MLPLLLKRLNTMSRVIQNIINFLLKFYFVLYPHIKYLSLSLQTTLQALERSQRENNVLSERLGAVSCPFL